MFKRIVEKFNRCMEEEQAARQANAALFANAAVFASDFLDAIEKGDMQTVDAFFNQKGVSPNDRLAQMGICTAAQSGHEKMIDLLLSKGVAADSPERAAGCKTAIDIARANGHEAIADKLQKAAGAKAKPSAAPKAP